MKHQVYLQRIKMKIFKIMNKNKKWERKKKQQEKVVLKMKMEAFSNSNKSNQWKKEGVNRKPKEVEKKVLLLTKSQKIKIF